MRKYEERVKRGMKLLNKVYRRRWLRWIDLSRLKMSAGRFQPESRGSCGCIGAQIDAHKARPGEGRYSRFLHTLYSKNEVEPRPAELGFERDTAMRLGSYRGLTVEWKRQIREARGEEVKA